MMSVPASYVLGIESAIAGGSVSLLRDGVEISCVSGEGSISRAEELLPRIHQLLQRCELSVRDLGFIVVSTGPGSYTGIRVGVATTLGLRLATKARCLGLTVLRAMTLTAKKNSDLMTAIPMGRNMVCSQLFDGDNSVSTPQLSTTEDFIESTCEFSGTVIVHRSLFKAVNDRGSADVIDAGDNLASLVAAAASSAFATEDLAPLFVDRL